MKALFPQLEALILRLAPDHVAGDKAPETLSELNAWRLGVAPPWAMPSTRWTAAYHPVMAHYSTGLNAYVRGINIAYLPVWNGASGSTIYSSPEVNFAYRAWHDHLHLELQRSTSLADELIVSQEHRRIAEDAGLPEIEVRALWYDSHGQNAYYARHGTFMEDQRAFVLACLAFGLEGALRTRW